MLQLTDSLTDPADHLALDEAMLLAADQGESGQAIRLWHFDRAVVVAGRATRIEEEIDIDFCRTKNIPVLRRCSGGAAIVGGPGCLMYSVVLSVQQQGLRKIDVAHDYVMSRLLRALHRQLPDVRWQGTCDLTRNGRKFSGNSLRIARHHLLYHGTILYDADLALISRALRQPPRQPDYRQGRDHQQFITNCSLDIGRLRGDLHDVFGAVDVQNADRLASWIRRLRAERYDDRRWHFRH